MEKRLKSPIKSIPEISLKEARERREEYRTLVAEGVDPAAIRKAEKQSGGDHNSFEVIARG